MASSLPNIQFEGGFLAGLVIPKTNGFDIALVEKLEDFISLLFLPQVCSRSDSKACFDLDSLH